MLATLKIKQIKMISLELYEQMSEYGKKSFDIIADKIDILYRATKRLWAIFEQENLMCIIGVVPATMLGSGIVTYFFLGAKADVKKLFRFLRRGLKLMTKFYPDMTAQVAVDFPTGDRFATYFGFKRIDYIYDVKPVPYRNYMLRT